ncbi:hypothetical protein S245_004988, partial [Arachis hypogaea]
SDLSLLQLSTTSEQGTSHGVSSFIYELTVLGYFVFCPCLGFLTSASPVFTILSFAFPRRISATMSSLGTSKGILEIAKFGVYVTVPIVLMYTFANNTKNLQKFMGNKSYIEYPPEAPRPPSPEELREKARELARKRNNP